MTTFVFYGMNSGHNVETGLEREESQHSMVSEEIWARAGGSNSFSLRATSAPQLPSKGRV